MGRAPCCDKANVKRGPWSPEEDSTLKAYIEEHGTGGNWIALPHKIGLKRCGKSCRLRWLNYLRPNIKHGGFSEEEDNIICNLYISIGSRWSIIAAQLPGRTDNDIKNYWNTRLKKKLLGRRKHSGANRGNHDLKDVDDTHQTLSSSALERLQLHMQLQSLQNPLGFYNSPTALWPKLHPYHEKLIQTVQSMNDQISSSPDLMMPHQLSDNVSQTQTAHLAIQEQYASSNSFLSTVDSTSFPAHQLDATKNSIGFASQQQDELDGFMWWANELDNKSVSSNSWDSSSVLQSHGMFQDYQIGFI